MNHSLGIIVLGLFAPLGVAGQIKWTAAGTVGSVAGAEFSALASVSDPVQIEFSYNDGAAREGGSGFPGFWSIGEYRVDVNIDLNLTIGGNTWHGTLDTGMGGGIGAIKVTDFQIGGVPGSPTSDNFLLKVAAGDGGGFPSFPGVPVGALQALELCFSDSSSSAPAPDYLGSDDLTCVAQSASKITEASGEISAGAGKRIQFSIDPATIETEVIGVQRLELRAISYDQGEVTMTWGTVADKLYIVQYLDTSLCWRELFTVVASGSETTETFFPSGFIPTELYRVVQFD